MESFELPVSSADLTKIGQQTPNVLEARTEHKDLAKIQVRCPLGGLTLRTEKAAR